VHEWCIIWEKEVFLMHIGERIKARRVSLGWSQRELAEKMGYKNHSVVARVEAGSVDLPQSKVVKFAEVLGTTPAVLMGWVSEETNKKNNDLVFLINKMRNDPEFFEAVMGLSKLSAEEFASVKPLLGVLSNRR
jgi:transcriptional regulator with XRE-family HTH domain